MSIKYDFSYHIKENEFWWLLFSKGDSKPMIWIQCFIKEVLNKEKALREGRVRLDMKGGKAI